LGYPGVLPVLNQEVLASAVKLGLAIDGKITPHSKFDRKQYFYPDLPKNYQISQYDLPIVEQGQLEIEIVDKKTKEVSRKIIGITRLHMEEDAGKLVHAGSERLSGSTHSLVDFNRTGVPLLEIVSEPDLRTGTEAAEYAQELRRLVRYLGISDGTERIEPVADLALAWIFRTHDRAVAAAREITAVYGQPVDVVRLS